MQRLFWIGNPFFCHSLRSCGWETQYFNFQHDAVFSWEDMTAQAGWEPDVVVVADKSRPPFVLGMEDFPCLTVFYCVDSHIHSWYPFYAQGFDVCLVSLKDHLGKFQGGRLTEEHIWWSPPFAHEQDAPVSGVQPQWDCLFVGSTNAELLPRRGRFLEELRLLVPELHAVRGNYRELFHQAKVLLNHSENGDLNFRVFEALGCGGCLVTPRVEHGLAEMFVDGEHLSMYAPHDAGDAALRIRELLADPARAERMAQAGLAAVDAAHRARHRAAAFTERLWALEKEAAALIARRRAQAPQIRQQWLRVPYLLLAEQMPSPSLRKAYLEASGGVFSGGGS